MIVAVLAKRNATSRHALFSPRRRMRGPPRGAGFRRFHIRFYVDKSVLEIVFRDVKPRIFGFPRYSSTFGAGGRGRRIDFTDVLRHKFKDSKFEAERASRGDFPAACGRGGVGARPSPGDRRPAFAESAERRTDLLQGIRPGSCADG